MVCGASGLKGAGFTALGLGPDMSGPSVMQEAPYHLEMGSSTSQLVVRRFLIHCCVLDTFKTGKVYGVTVYASTRRGDNAEQYSRVAATGISWHVENMESHRLPCSLHAERCVGSAHAISFTPAVPTWDSLDLSFPRDTPCPP